MSSQSKKEDKEKRSAIEQAIEDSKGFFWTLESAQPFIKAVNQEMQKNKSRYSLATCCWTVGLSSTLGKHTNKITFEKLFEKAPEHVDQNWWKLYRQAETLDGKLCGRCIEPLAYNQKKCTDKIKIDQQQLAAMNIDNKQLTKRIIDLENQAGEHQKNEEEAEKRIKTLEDSIKYLCKKVMKMDDKIEELKNKKSNFLENGDPETDDENVNL